MSLLAGTAPRGRRSLWGGPGISPQDALKPEPPRVRGAVSMSSAVPESGSTLGPMGQWVEVSQE